jgi:uncharacterized protein (TIGR00369 family)
MSELFDLEAINTGNAPFGKHLGLRITRAEKDCVEAELKVEPHLCTIPATLHGGAFMALADNVGGIATFLNLDLAKGQGTTTIESKTNFFRPVPVGTTAKAVATPLHRGRKTQVWRTDIFTEEGKLAASVTQTQMVLQAG